MPANEPKPGGEIVLYQTEDGRTRIECRFEKENVWMTQALMAELFQTTPQNITLHLKAIYEDGELAEAATCKDYLQVRAEGARQVQRALRHYNLAAILAVGYRGTRTTSPSLRRPVWAVVVNSIRSAWTGEPSSERRSQSGRASIRWLPGDPRSSRRWLETEWPEVLPR